MPLITALGRPRQEDLETKQNNNKSNFNLCESKDPLYLVQTSVFLMPAHNKNSIFAKEIKIMLGQEEKFPKGPKFLALKRVLTIEESC
jgi:hypothetical protein